MTNINDTQYKNISVPQAKAMLENLSCYTILLDVRKPFEYAEKHINGAINIPLEQLKSNINTFFPDKNQEIIVYCQSGSRSRNAALYLSCKGYTNVYDLGGMEDNDYKLI